MFAGEVASTTNRHKDIIEAANRYGLQQRAEMSIQHFGRIALRGEVHPGSIVLHIAVEHLCLAGRPVPRAAPISHARSPPATSRDNPVPRRHAPYSQAARPDRAGTHFGRNRKICVTHRTFLVYFVPHSPGTRDFALLFCPGVDMASEPAAIPPPDGTGSLTPVLPLLIVDDDPVVLRMLRDVLQENGFPVVSANNGVAALIHLRRSLVALVLTDHMMPGLSGLELADEMRFDPRTAAIPVILMAAYPLPDVGSRVAAVIGKPFALDELLRVVRQFWPQ